MLRAISGAASAMNALQIKTDTIANNLANVNTTGYKKSRTDFTELVGQELGSGGIPVGAGSQDQKKPTVGGGVIVSGIANNLMPGQLLETQRPLDLAVFGEGFFKVVQPGGEERYTRDGTFSLDAAGNLVNPSGYILEGVKMAPGAADFNIAADGKISVNDAGEITEAGQINIYKFSSASALKAEGENLFSAVGEAVEGVPGSDGFGTIRQGCLEASNVDLTEEMASLIEAQRAYSFSARIMRTADEMFGLANNLRK
ncbi:flagellar hook-basal body protein [Pelotomaculum propionicicum]|uniref:flagellar hook-basal body protein n=1 Tax=Pelotomaculum propionicicum TaxID=258475 RepID=UPI003B7B439E